MSIARIALLMTCIMVAICCVAQRSHEECLKGLPIDWGANFGPEWHGNEAKYWACRVGMPVRAIQELQVTANVEGAIQELIPIRLNSKEAIVLYEMQGTAHCAVVQAFLADPQGWKRIWSLQSKGRKEPMQYCTLACPAIRIKFQTGRLAVSTPESSNPKEDVALSCKKPRWSTEEFHWNGATFVSSRKAIH